MSKPGQRLRKRMAAAGLLVAWAAPAAARWQGLPSRIPIHFTLSGQPNGWASPNHIFLMPALALGIYLLLSIVVHFPQSFHYGVPVTDQNRARLNQITCDLISWLKAEILALLAVLEVLEVQSVQPAAQPGSMTWIMLAALLGGSIILGTILSFLVALQRAAKPQP